MHDDSKNPVAWRYRANGGPWELTEQCPFDGGSPGPNEQCEPLYAAPQASTENARLRELLARCQAWMLSSEYDRPNMLIALIQDALQSQPQADKEGCTCPSGDGSLRPCPMHPRVDKDGGQQRAVNPSEPTCPRCTLPLRQECNCDEGYAARAALSSPQAEQGERDA